MRVPVRYFWEMRLGLQMPLGKSSIEFLATTPSLRLSLSSQGMVIGYLNVSSWTYVAHAAILGSGGKARRNQCPSSSIVCSTYRTQRHIHTEDSTLRPFLPRIVGLVSTRRDLKTHVASGSHLFPKQNWDSPSTLDSIFDAIKASVDPGLIIIAFTIDPSL
jgi:hypothetical protein